MDLDLAQRGRAIVDWEVTSRKMANSLHAASIKELKSHGITADVLPDDMEERHDVIDRTLLNSQVFQARRLVGEWCAKNHGLAVQEAFDEVRDRIAPKLDALAQGPTTLETLPHYEMPGYFAKTHFHRTAGGWDAGDYNGFVHGKLIHDVYLPRTFPVDNHRDYDLVLGALPERPYDRILEIGTSSGYYTEALSSRFPSAEIWGIDPSLRMLEQAQRLGNEQGRPWKLFVGVAEDSRFESESFDLVTAYTVHHEIPPRIIRAIFKEAMRLLRPGGVMMFADVPPYGAIDKMSAWSFDWIARYHGEPYWRAASTMDYAAEAAEAGFIDIVSRGLSPNHFPHIIMGKKTA